MLVSQDLTGYIGARGSTAELSNQAHVSGAPNENRVQNHLIIN